MDRRILLVNCSLIFLLVLMMIVRVSGVPKPGDTTHARVRIHIPVKHHTHFHTKTIIKKVAVPVPVPVKHHHHEEDEEEEEYESYIVPKKKKYHPFI